MQLRGLCPRWFWLTAIILGVAVGCGGADSRPLPEAICSENMPFGNECVPGPDSFVRQRFEGVTTADEANALQTDGGFAESLVCASRQDEFVWCAAKERGVVMVVPVEIPSGRTVVFSGGNLTSQKQLPLIEGEPVGIRYDGPPLELRMANEDNELLYSLQTNR